MNRNQIEIGMTVEVHPKEGEEHPAHLFTGTVKGFHGDFVTVEDQDGEAWDYDLDQLSLPE